MPKLIDLLKAGATRVRKVNWAPDNHLEFPAHNENEIPLHCVHHACGNAIEMKLGEVDDHESYWEDVSPKESKQEEQNEHTERGAGHQELSPEIRTELRGTSKNAPKRHP